MTKTYRCRDGICAGQHPVGVPCSNCGERGADHYISHPHPIEGICEGFKS